MKDLSSQLKTLLKLNQIQLDWDEFQFQFQSHPSFPSLHAATGVLDHFNVDNIAARVPVDQDTLLRLPDSCIIQIKRENQLSLVILKRENDAYRLYNEDASKEKISSNDLLEIFTGIVLAIDKEDQNNEKVQNNHGLLIAGFSIAVLSIISLFYLNNISVEFTSYAFLSLLGLLISISILKQEFGERSLIGEAFCSQETVKKSCDAVINSNGAKILGNYKLSDLCLIYFSGLMLSLTMLNLQQLSFDGIVLISLVVLPVTLYSLYYQAFIVKTWCGLCLGIVSILWFIAGVSLITGSFQMGFSIGWAEALTIIFGFLLSFITWSVIKPKYKALNDAKAEKIEFHRFKKNFHIFSSLLTNQNPIDTQLDHADEIILGNPDSNLELLVVTNPFCGHCKKVHTLVENILNKSSDKLKIVIRFNIKLSQSDSEIVKLCSHLQRIYNTQPDDILRSMDDAYNNLKYDEWMKKWGTQSIDTSEYLKLLTAQKDWCKMNKINFTPYIAINGYAYPKEYDREDFKFFIEDLIEDSVELFHKKDRLQTAV